MADAPSYRVQGSTELAKGDRQALNDETQLAESLGGDQTAQADTGNPQNQVLGTGVDFSPYFGSGDSEGYDDALFAPTDRPDVPLTEGMPFGAGGMFTAGAQMEQRDHMNQLARRTMELANEMPDDMLRWAQRQLLES